MQRTALLVTALAAVTVSCSTASHSGQTAAKTVTVDPVKMTCAEFVALGDTLRPRAVAWLNGYDTAGRLQDQDVGEVDVDRQMAVLVVSCQQDPKQTLWEKLRGHFPGGSKKVRPTKMTCEDFSELSVSEKPEVAYWLDGYDKAAGVQENAVDQVDLQRDVAVIVQVCKDAPKESLWAKIKSHF